MTHKLVILLCPFVVTDTALQLGGRGAFGKSSVCLSTMTSQGRIGDQTLPGLLTEPTGKDGPVGLLRDRVSEALRKSSNINGVFVAKKAWLSVCWSLVVCAHSVHPGEGAGKTLPGGVRRLELSRLSDALLVLLPTSRFKSLVSDVLNASLI